MFWPRSIHDQHGEISKEKNDPADTKLSEFLFFSSLSIISIVLNHSQDDYESAVHILVCLAETIQLGNRLLRRNVSLFIS